MKTMDCQKAICFIGTRVPPVRKGLVHMKWRSRTLVFLLLLLFVLTACSPRPLDDPDKKPVFKLTGLKGPTSMGLAPLVSKAQAGDLPFDADFDVVASPEELVPMIVRGDCDLAALPANLAATLYQKTEGKILVLAINTLGVLDIVERGDSVHSLEDLAGRTVYASGEGAVPQYVLNLLLEKSGLDPDKDLDLVWMAEHGAIVARMQAEEGSVALLPQPFVTIAQKQMTDLRLALDLNDDWERLIPDAGLVMGVLVAQKETVEKNPQAIEAFLAAYKEAIDLTNESPDQVAALIQELDIFDAAVAREAIPYCNIHFADKEAMKNALSGFLTLLMGINPQSVGGQLPGEDFYYGAK